MDENVLKEKELRQRNLTMCLRPYVAHANRSQACGPSEGHADGERGKSRRSEPQFGRGGMVYKSKNREFRGYCIVDPGFCILGINAARANKANTPATPAANELPATAAAATPAEPHPQIREALGALRRAKGHMERAAHDFGGHRVEALRATEEAIRQLEICLKFDKD